MTPSFSLTPIQPISLNSATLPGVGQIQVPAQNNSLPSIPSIPGITPGAVPSLPSIPGVTPGGTSALLSRGIAIILGLLLIAAGIFGFDRVREVAINTAKGAAAA